MADAMLKTRVGLQRANPYHSEKCMSRVKLFVSHSTKYGDIAKSLKLSLQALESETLLDIKISEEMAGATDWRRWIEETVRSSDIFLLLYPHASMDMGWCNYELGRFYDEQRHVVCIKNTDIANPPPAFQPYQAYDADEPGFTKFIQELFVSGTFTNGTVLNADIGNPATDYYARAKNVARGLAQQFAEARVREHLYEGRLVISVRYNDAKQFDMEKTRVQGNAGGLNLLGLDELAIIKWSAVRQSLSGVADWPAELERAMPSITSGVLPPPLPPFRAPTGIYIPLIAKAESVDDILRQLILIFVPTNVDQLWPLLDWSFPQGMPETFKFLLQLVRMMCRARWEILEPRYQEAKYRAPSAECCGEIARSVIADYDQMQRDAENEGMNGLDKFYTAFHSELRADVESCGEEWMQLSKRLRETSAGTPEELSRQLKDFLGNNAKWLVIAGKEFTLTVANFV
jgi:hypothetical protein